MSHLVAHDAFDLPILSCDINLLIPFAWEFPLGERLGLENVASYAKILVEPFFQRHQPEK